MLKAISFFLIVTTMIDAHASQSREEINLEKCGSTEYRFDSSSKECVYCAQGLQYDDNLKCVGIPDVLGKCYGDHHYHAATQECMFCAVGYHFNETSRLCEGKK